MSLAKEFACGHFRFLPTRLKSCPICNRPGQRRDKAMPKEVESHRKHFQRTAEKVRGTIKKIPAPGKH